MTKILSTALLNLYALNEGVLDAVFVTKIEGLGSEVNTIYGLSGILGLGNEEIILTDTSINVGLINSIDSKTSGVINANSITTLTGTATDLESAYTSSGINGLGNEAVTLSDSSLAASLLNNLDGRTSGAINANSITTLTGTAADIHSAYTSSGINGLGNEAVTLSDTSLAASLLNNLDARTSGAINANSINTLTGKNDELLLAFAAQQSNRDRNQELESSGSGSIVGLNNPAVTITDTVTVEQANAMAALTTGAVTATISEGDLASLIELNETGNAYTITINDASVDAAILNKIRTKTTAKINANAINTITGTLLEISTIYNSSQFIGLGNEAISITSTTIRAADLNAIDAATNNVINAAGITTLVGSVDDLNQAYGSTGIAGLGNEAVILEDKTIDPIKLNRLNGKTSGDINANSIQIITGSTTNIRTIYESAGINNLGNEALKLTDTSLNASELRTLDGYTLSTIDGSSINTLSGSATDLIAVYTSSGIIGLGNETIQISSGNATTNQANTISAKTSGIVTATISDGDLITLAGLKETGHAYTISILDTSVDAAALNALDGKTTIAINGASITSLSGSASDLNTAYASTGISGLGNEKITLSNTTVDAADLNRLDSRTSGVIDASSVTTITGNRSALNTAYSSPGISGLVIDIEGITILGPSARITGTILTDDAYWQVDDAIDSGHRIVLSGSLLAELVAEMGTMNQIQIGFKNPSTWSDGSAINSASYGGLWMRIRRHSGQYQINLLQGSSQVSSASIGATWDPDTNIFFELTSDGNNIQMGASKQQDAASVHYNNWNGIKQKTTGQSFDLSQASLIFRYVEGSGSNDLNLANIDWDALNEMSSPPSTDTTAPSIASIGANPGWARKGQTNTINISLTEFSEDFTLSDVSCIGGTLSNWNPVSKNYYRATFTPQANRTSNAEVSVANFSFSDKAGNFNNNGTKSVIIRVDTVPPEIELEANKLSLGASDQATINFEVSESTSDFHVNDLSVSGGSISNFTGSGRSYSAVFTPNVNSTTNGLVSVANSKFTDSFGNLNEDGSDANNKIAFNINTVRPTIAISSDQESLKAGDTAKITFILSEFSTDFTLSDVEVSGGTLAEFSGAGDRYSAIFKPNASSTKDGVISVSNNAFSDAEGNTNQDETDPNNSINLKINTLIPLRRPPSNPSPSPDDSPLVKRKPLKPKSLKPKPRQPKSLTKKPTDSPIDLPDQLHPPWKPAPPIPTSPTKLIPTSKKDISIPISIIPLNAKNRRASFRLRINAKKGTDIVDLNHALTGLDQDRQGRPLNYSISRGNDQNIFSINQKGILSLNRSIESQASDQRIYMVTIRATHSNDQNPTFIQTAIIFTDSSKPQRTSCSPDTTIKTKKTTATGSSCHETWTGDNLNERAHGKAGQDTLRGQAGDDTLQGGNGRDIIHGGHGTDLLIGNRHRDRLFGRPHADTLKGGLHDDTLRGNRGTDRLRGQHGDDILRGGSHNDTLRGGSGNDTLCGGPGNDTLHGGAGADLFRMSNGRDTIIDFQIEQGDRLKLIKGVDININQSGQHLILKNDDETIHTTLENINLDNFSSLLAQWPTL